MLQLELNATEVIQKHRMWFCVNNPGKYKNAIMYVEKFTRTDINKMAKKHQTLQKE
jgi:hypothetical protein